MNPMKDFMPAPFDIECVDVWPPGRYTDIEVGAYRRMERRGRVRNVTAWNDPVNGNTVVRYFADIPAPWIRAELREEKYRGIQMEVAT